MHCHKGSIDSSNLCRLCGVCRNVGDDRQPSAGAEQSTPLRPIASRPNRPELTFRSRPQVSCYISLAGSLSNALHGVT